MEFSMDFDFICTDCVLKQPCYIRCQSPIPGIEIPTWCPWKGTDGVGWKPANEQTALQVPVKTPDIPLEIPQKQEQENKENELGDLPF
jgi:hypothetical protein